MGNVQQQFSSFVGNSPLGLFNEDTFLVVLKHLTVADYAHLTMLCRTFNQLFGSNNFLWAQMCEKIAENYVDEPLTFLGDSALLPDQASSVARILLAAFKGEKLTVNGTPLKPNDELNLRDKNLVSQLNFKEAVKRHYIHVVQRQFLQDLCLRLVSGTTASVAIEVRTYDGQFNDVWTKADLKKHKCARDFYYYVNFQCNPKKLEKMQKGNKTPAHLVSEIGGRLVVYQKSDVEPQWFRFVSRMPYRPKAVPNPVLRRK